jgi:hypothetical protein
MVPNDVRRFRDHRSHVRERDPGAEINGSILTLCGGRKQYQLRVGEFHSGFSIRLRRHLAPSPPKPRRGDHAGGAESRAHDPSASGRNSDALFTAQIQSFLDLNAKTIVGSWERSVTTVCVSSGKSEHYRSFKRCIFFLHIEVRIRYAQPYSTISAGWIPAALNPFNSTGLNGVGATQDLGPDSRGFAFFPTGLAMRVSKAAAFGRVAFWPLRSTIEGHQRSGGRHGRAAVQPLQSVFRPPSVLGRSVPP